MPSVTKRRLFFLLTLSDQREGSQGKEREGSLYTAVGGQPWSRPGHGSCLEQ